MEIKDLAYDKFFHEFLQLLNQPNIDDAATTAFKILDDLISDVGSFRSDLTQIKQTRAMINAFLYLHNMRKSPIIKKLC